MAIDWTLLTRHYIAPPVDPVSDLTVSYTDRATDGTSDTSYTFSGMSTGAAPTGAEERWIVVGVVLWGATNTPNLTSVTIGGNTVTIQAQDEDATADVSVSVGHIKIDTGTSESVVVTCDADTDGCAVCLFRVITLDSQDLSQPPLHHHAIGGVGDNPYTINNVRLEDGGAYVCLGAADINDPATGITFEDASDSSTFGTEAFDEDVSGAGRWAAMSGVSSVNDTGFDVDVRGSGTAPDLVGAFIIFYKV